MNDELAATFRTGLIALAREEIDVAEPLLREVVAEAPENADALAYLATAWVVQGRVEAAREAMDLALTLAPGRFGPNLKAGELDLRLGDLTPRSSISSRRCRSPPMARATPRQRERSWARRVAGPAGRSSGRPRFRAGDRPAVLHGRLAAD